MTRTRETAKLVFGEEMQPCPKCSGFHIGWSMPIKLLEPVTQSDSAKDLLRKWAQARKASPQGTPLEGHVRLMCRDCGCLGPSVDVSWRTSEDVGKDPVVAKKCRDLWNMQKPPGDSSPT